MTKEEAPKKGWAKTALIGCIVGGLLLYIASYITLSRSAGGMLNPDYPRAGFVYVSWKSWDEHGDNSRPRALHSLLYAFYSPLNYVDARVFGGLEAVPPRQLGR